jgi:ABC-type dipeptide/oligopeptide/nickel transport system permease subunit
MNEAVLSSQLYIFLGSVMGAFTLCAVLLKNFTRRAQQHLTGHSLWSDALRRLLSDQLAVWSFIIICAFTVVAVLCRLDWLAADWQTELGAPRTDANFAANWRYWFGLDLFGRSISAKTLQATWTAMYVGFMSALISIPIGFVVGAVAGYFGGWIDDVISWILSTMASIPEILLLVAVATALEKGLFSVCIALGVTSWVSLARLIRGEFMKHKNREYVTAAAAIGGGHARRIFKHIFPNVLHIIIIRFSLTFVIAIKSEVVLTYLGLGAPTGTASWGIMIDDAKGELIRGFWWNLNASTLAMFLIVLAFSLFADALRDAVDPKLRT